MSKMSRGIHESGCLYLLFVEEPKFFPANEKRVMDVQDKSMTCCMNLQWSR